MNKKLMIAPLILILTATAFYFLYDRVWVYAVSKIYNLEITYSSIKSRPFSEIKFTDLRAIDKNTGFGFCAKDARITTRISIRVFDNLSLEMDVKDLSFIKNPTDKNVDYDNIPNLIMVPFNSNWKYNNISTAVRISREKITVLGFNAIGADIKLDFKGDLFYAHQLFGEMRIYFSENVLRRIPEPLVREVLTDADGGWKSLLVNISGDYKSPSIKISSKLFRMNVKTVVQGE